MNADGYVTEISVPAFADNDGWRLHARMPQAEPLPEPEPEPEAGR